jgi:hypothetical protein
MGAGVEDAAQPFWIYSYDLWWPPLLIWLSACFLDGAITILGVAGSPRSNGDVPGHAARAVVASAEPAGVHRSEIGRSVELGLLPGRTRGPPARALARLERTDRVCGRAAAPARGRPRRAARRTTPVGPRNDRRLAWHLGARVARPAADGRSAPGGAGPRDDRRQPRRHLLPGLAAPCRRPGGPRDRVDVPRRGHGAGPAQGVRRQRRAGGLRGARPVRSPGSARPGSC